MKNYEESYNQATKKLLDLASRLDVVSIPRFDAQYKLYDITYALRDLYSQFMFRKKFVGNQEFNGFVPWPKGFCALSSICIYELYGGNVVWEPYAIKLGTWDYAPVVFLRNNFTGDAFDPTGDQFAPLNVPYDIGSPINKSIKDMKTPNKAEFVRVVKKYLDRQL